MPTTFSPIALRPVLAQAPTPITAVAGLVDAQPTSMIVASFIRLSLDPPLGRVSYMRNQTRIAASTTPARYVTASLS